MRKIVAIGGGNVGRNGSPVETTRIDKEIVRLSEKTQPRFLFIPTASADCRFYCEAIYKQFGKKLGCRVDILMLFNRDPLWSEIKEKISTADIIYVGEGNTYRMMRYWKKYGVDKVMREAMNNGTVLCGSSAGSIAWFHSGLSDSWKSEENPERLIRVKGLGFIDGTICPHFNTEPHRVPAFKMMLRKTGKVGLALDDLSAIAIVGNDFRIIPASKNCKASISFWKKGEYHERELENEPFAPLSSLFTKKGVLGPAQK